MMIDSDVLLWIAGLLVGVVGWFGRSLVSEMRKLGEAIQTLNSTQQVASKTLEIVNSGMLENRRHIGELFHDCDTIRQDVSAIKAVCDVQHKGARK